MAEKTKQSSKEAREKLLEKLDIKLFNRWSFKGVKVRDITLREYINLRPVIVPSTGGRWQKKRFGRRKYNIVERLINKLMVIGHIRATRKHIFTSGRNTGKKQKAMKIVEKAFEIIEKKTGRNPIQVLVEAIENAAPRAEVTTVEYGGIRTPVAVDTSPLRRVDLALSFLAKGAAQRAIRNPKKIHEALAEELILASESSPESFAIDRKNMLEKQAEASR